MLKWDQEIHGLGIDKIDEQHEKLFNLVNDLRYRFHAGPKGEGVSEAIIQLVQFGNEHFTFEEAFLSSINFPHYASHKRTHAGFNRRIKEYLLRLKNNRPVSYFEILAFLQDWIVKHILKDDARYAEFYHAVVSDDDVRSNTIQHKTIESL